MYFGNGQAVGNTLERNFYRFIPVQRDELKFFLRMRIISEKNNIDAYKKEAYPHRFNLFWVGGHLDERKPALTFPRVSFFPLHYKAYLQI